MAHARRRGLSALAVTAVIACGLQVEGQSRRHLLQTLPVGPGCTRLQESFVATNPDYRDFFTVLNALGLNNTLSSLSSTYTVFAPTNEALEGYNAAAGVTDSEDPASPFELPGFQLLIVPEAIPDPSTFVDGEVLPTLEGSNLTVFVDTVNGTEEVTISSPGSEGTIITPPQYACHLVIYGVNGAFVPENNLFDNALPGSIHNLTHYLESLLVPGGPGVPITAIIDAVKGGRVAEVATAFDQAVQAGLANQLIAILQQAVVVPGGVAALGQVANVMIVQSGGCATLLPIIHQLYPTLYSTPASLGLSAADLQNIPVMDPQLAACAVSAG